MKSAESGSLLPGSWMVVCFGRNSDDGLWNRSENGTGCLSGVGEPGTTSGPSLDIRIGRILYDFDEDLTLDPELWYKHERLRREIEEDQNSEDLSIRKI